MKREEKRKIAREIIKLEQRYESTKDKSILMEIERIALSLSIEDMLEVDEYITSKKLLT